MTTPSGAIADSRSSLRAFLDDEEGLQTLEVVMIMAVAAVILAVIVMVFPTIRTWFYNRLNEVFTANGSGYTASTPSGVNAPQ
jgi:Flp pilus assembly pilin Flp